LIGSANIFYLIRRYSQQLALDEIFSYGQCLDLSSKEASFFSMFSPNQQICTARAVANRSVNVGKKYSFMERVFFDRLDK